MTEADRLRVIAFGRSLPPNTSGDYVSMSAVPTDDEIMRAETLHRQTVSILRVLQLSIRQAAKQSGLMTGEQINAAVADASEWFEDRFAPELATAIDMAKARRKHMKGD